MQLFQEAAEGLKEAATVKRESIGARSAKMQEIVNGSPEDHFLLWHDLESERMAILKAIPGVVDIYGAMDYDLREQRVIDFSNGKSRLFATRNPYLDPDVTFRDIATERSFWELIMSSMISFRQSTGATDSCRRNR